MIVCKLLAHLNRVCLFFIVMKEERDKIYDRIIPLRESERKFPTFGMGIPHFQKVTWRYHCSGISQVFCGGIRGY